MRGQRRLSTSARSLLGDCSAWRWPSRQDGQLPDRPRTDPGVRLRSVPHRALQEYSLPQSGLSPSCPSRLRSPDNAWLFHLIVLEQFPKACPIVAAPLNVLSVLASGPLTPSPSASTRFNGAVSSLVLSLPQGSGSAVSLEPALSLSKGSACFAACPRQGGVYASTISFGLRLLIAATLARRGRLDPSATLRAGPCPTRTHTLSEAPSLLGAPTDSS